MKIYTDIFEQITSLENLFLSWDKFKKDKQKKKDVLAFEWNLESNILNLYRDLKYHRYRHGVYTSFYIHDPKQRKIHKAIVRDRVLHHAVFRILNPIFEPAFISHSFSCRIGKGTHKGINALKKMLVKVSNDGRRPCFALKCDIKKFFGSVDHGILFGIVKKQIKDAKALWLIEEIISSFGRDNSRVLRQAQDSRESSQRGLPIGNLTSQLFANIYLNEFDYFIKHQLKIKNYVRFTDDFVIVLPDKESLLILIPKIKRFLAKKLKLKVHPDKILIRKYNQGVDFLGYVLFPYYRFLRTKTKRGIFRKLKKRVFEYRTGVISKEILEQSFNSYFGVLSHADTYELQEDLKNQFWDWLNE